MPVASVTLVIPPRPSARASAAAHSRVMRSSITGAKARNFDWSCSTAFIIG